MFLTTTPDFGLDNSYRVIDLVMASAPPSRKGGALEAFHSALLSLMESAERLGANAIVGVRAQLGPKYSMFVYGTAVRLDRGGAGGLVVSSVEADDVWGRLSPAWRGQLGR